MGLLHLSISNFARIAKWKGEGFRTPQPLEGFYLYATHIANIAVSFLHCVRRACPFGGIV
jgi:hypothetical protein